MTKHDPFRYFKTSREIIRLAVMMYLHFPLSLRQVEDLLHERGMPTLRPCNNAEWADWQSTVAVQLGRIVSCRILYRQLAFE